MQLRPQDVVILLKLGAHPGEPFAQKTLAEELGMSAGEVSGGSSGQSPRVSPRGVPTSALGLSMPPSRNS